MAQEKRLAGESLAAQVEALRRMSAGELRERYQEVFGGEPRSSNRQHLFKRVAWQIQADAEGGLSENAKHRIDELAPEAAALRSGPQEEKPSAPKSRPKRDRHVRDARLPQPGTLLIREYKGRRVEVEVLEKGFVYEGKTYRSLSAVAREVTGSHWNGLLFFGLTKPKGGKR